MFEEIEAMVGGKVQMVMYRDFVRISAAELGVRGFVENVADGTVRVVAQGAPDALKALIKCLHEGSVLSRVAQVSVTWRAPNRQYEDFSVRYSRSL